MIMHMMTKVLGAILLAALWLSPNSMLLAQAAGSQQTAVKGDQASLDQDIQLLRRDVASEKKRLIAANLTLTDTEATKFWPVYDQYQADYKKIGDAKVALIKEYAQTWGSVTDEQALQYLRRSQDIEDSVLQLRKKYLPTVNQVLPGKKTATFFQLDRRINLLLDVKLASEIPLVQDQGN
jgi:hypothetical protein